MRMPHVADRFFHRHKADPNDPTVAQKFREQVLEPQLEDFGSDAATEAGQSFAQSHVAALRNHMFEKTAADMSTLAGVAAKVNFEKTVNALSNTAMNDPSSLDHSLQIAESSIKGMAGSAPNLSAADAARVTDEGLQHAKEQIVKSASHSRASRLMVRVVSPFPGKLVDGGPAAL